MTAEIKARGLPVSRERVRKLMQAAASALAINAVP